MNTSSDSDRSGNSTGRAPGNGFFGWLRSTGITRSDDRWFAGVAGGIAQKAGIDPLIVRGIFVVLALLGGPGLLIYLVGWIFLPDAVGRINAEEVVNGRASKGLVTTAIVLAVIFIAIPVLVGLTGGLFQWSLWHMIGIPGWVTGTVGWLFWVAVIVAACIWAHRMIIRRGQQQPPQQDSDPRGPAQQGPASSAAPRAPGAPSFTAGSDGTVTGGDPDRGNHPRADAGAGTRPADSQPSAPDPSASFSEQTRTFTDRTNEQVADWGRRASTKTAEWGDKANQWGEKVGKQADDWSARYAEHHEAHRLGAAHVILTLALALLAAGGAALWALEVGPGIIADALAPAPLMAAIIAGLGVFAVSLIVAGIRGKHTGWIGFLSFCGVLALLFTAVFPWGTRFHAFGVSDISGAQDRGVVMVAGSARIDLRDLDALPATESRSSVATTAHDLSADDGLTVWQLAGNATVTLPREHPVVVDVRMFAGNISERGGAQDGNRVSGPFLSRTVTANLPAGQSVAGAREAGVTTVTVYMLAGNARIESPSGSGSGSRSGSADSQAENRAALEDLERELSLVEWQLEEPGLSPEPQHDLENQRDEIRESISDLEKEMAR